MKLRALHLALALTVLSAWTTSPRMARAEKFDPDLGEAADWLSRAAAPGGPAVAATAPADAPELARHPMPAERVEPLIEELPGRPFTKTDPKPVSRIYWKYPLYAIFGLPRDCIDSVFGFFSFWPLFNIPITGVCYEVVPTQALMRDPRDWHRWPGRRNHNKHGFVDSEGWGWFPTANSMTFSRPDAKKLERIEAENKRLREELDALNKKTETRNREIAQRQRDARKAAVAAIDAGHGGEAVEWILPYRLAYPADELAQALLINALASWGDEAPEWARLLLWREISGVNLRVLHQAQTLLAKSQRDFPNSLTLTEAVVYAHSRLEKSGDALKVAEEGFKGREGDATRGRILFEAAMTARDRDKAGEALAALDKSTSADQVAPLRLRLLLLEGKVDEAHDGIARLAEAAPENPYYQYYLGCAELALAERSDAPKVRMQEALNRLERASLATPAGPLQDRVGRALSFTRSLTADKNAPAKTRRREGPIDIKF